MVAKSSRKTKSTAADFERALKELEAVVEQLEQGDISLEDSLKQFERGIALTRACQESLKAAEQKVQILIEKDGQVETAPFQDFEDD